MTKPSDTSGANMLGQQTDLPASPDEAVLERVPNPHPDTRYVARFTVPEFTSICPVTGQPDFARLVIDYVPDEYLVESKSFKLYMGSFRNHGAFHEDCTIAIAKRLVDTLAPHWLRIGGYWYPRGGIPIDVFWQSGAVPQDLYVPDPGIAPYQGR
ncbi:MAG TPA: NADPH-dependent 7-cyano-7-deazaguanine reductase QueF [Rhodobiaceae bacterium]|jgi:7-cyano-7-deazaguanine reductase|nr:NADPH-dependent 7-cyano-7-deazaguanine reductase QueF [Rhodobiaceae bacterium]